MRKMGEDLKVELLKTTIAKNLDTIYDCTYKLGELLNKKVEESIKFSWDNFKARKIAINCTRDNVRAFLGKCDGQNIIFSQGDSLNLVTWFDRISYLYDEEVCFMYNDNIVGGLCHSEKSWFEGEGFEIIEYKDIPFVKTIEDYSDKELVAELLKRHK